MVLLIEKPHFLVENTAMSESIVRFPATGTIPPPPDELATAGRELWTKVNERFVIEPAHQQLLLLACLSADSAAAAGADQARRRNRHRLDRTDGCTPLAAAEGAAQKRIAAFMRQLDLFSEEKRDRPGRPPKPFGGY